MLKIDGPRMGNYVFEWINLWLIFQIEISEMPVCMEDNTGTSTKTGIETRKSTGNCSTQPYDSHK